MYGMKFTFMSEKRSSAVRPSFSKKSEARIACAMGVFCVSEACLNWEERGNRASVKVVDP